MTVHVAYAADANYGPYAGISIASVIRYFRGQYTSTLHFHLLSDGVKRRDRERIDRTVIKGKARWTLHHMDLVLQRNLNSLMRQPKYLTRAAYSRLFMAEMLQDVERVIYLDCDTLACSDIFRTLEADRGNASHGRLSQHPAAARLQARNRLIARRSIFQLGRCRHEPCGMRRDNIGPKLVEAASKIPNCKFYDQDPLNVVLGNRTTALPGVWNVQISAEPAPPDARIIHFCGTKKPWQLGYVGGGLDLFREAKSRSRWCHMLPELGIHRTIRRVQRSLKKRDERRRSY